MNVYIRTDIEGIPGINTMDDIIPRGTESYERSCRHLEETLNWVVETCFENGADNVYYYDGHARAGTLGGFLDHTFKSRVIFEFQINGQPFCERAYSAAILGHYNVPCVMCVGDRVACEQAKEYIPEIKAAIVKEGTERNLCHDLPNAEQIIRETTADALKNYRNIPPYKVSLPATIQQTTYRSDMTDEIYAAVMAKGNPKNVERVDARTLRRVATEINSYWDLRVSG